MRTSASYSTRRADLKSACLDPYDTGFGAVEAGRQLWRPRGPSHNMIVGQNAAAEDGVRRCHLFGNGLRSAEVAADAQFVIPTGGGYSFTLSLSALTALVAPSSPRTSALHESGNGGPIWLTHT
jgi:hypothetical protein